MRCIWTRLFVLVLEPRSYWPVPSDLTTSLQPVSRKLLKSSPPATSLHLLHPRSALPVVSMIHFQTSCCATTNTFLWQLLKKTQHKTKKTKTKNSRSDNLIISGLIISCINWPSESTSTPLGLQNGLLLLRGRE